MKKLILILTLLLVFSNYTIALANTGANSAKELNYLVDKYIDKRTIDSGLAIAIFDSETFLKEKYLGHMDIENGLKFDEDTILEWGSVSKLLIWISAMQLQEKGKLDLDADIKTYLDKDFMDSINLKSAICMKNLMNHNAGFEELYYDLLLPKDYNKKSLKDALLKNIPEQIFSPSEVTIYSNYGTALAAYIVEEISGMDYSEYVAKNIFEPLGMKNSAIAPTLADDESVKMRRENLKCYTINGNLIKDDFCYMPLYPAGTMSSNLKDLAIFGKAILKKDERIMKEKTWNEFFTPTSFYEDTNIASNCHGMWVLPYEIKILGHHGNTKGCSSKLLLDLENNRGIAIMTNVRNEIVFNEMMPEYLFGNFSYSDYFKADKAPKGFYKLAQTEQNGPLKLSGMKYLKAEKFENKFLIHANKNVERLSLPHQDFLKVPNSQPIIEMILLISWIFSFLIAVISTIFLFVMRFKQKFKDNLPLFSFLLEIIITGLVIFSAMRMLNYDFRAEIFKITFILISILSLILAIITLRTLIKPRLETAKKSSKYIILFTQFTILINIIYWKIFMFWKI
ncbi:MAG: serine hydrolase domain-containing protein [Tissierellia bacterium]|nr:serine hydrolase domain-containing protein [Tissierellia bacterium]